MAGLAACAGGATIPRLDAAEWIADWMGAGNDPVAAAAVPVPTNATIVAAAARRRTRRTWVADLETRVWRLGAVRTCTMAGTVCEPHPDCAGATPWRMTSSSEATGS
jgi:hypothetical protein